jgi:hypothetical protein
VFEEERTWQELYTDFGKLDLFGNQNDIFTMFYSLVEHLGVGKLFFRHYILRELDEMLLFYTPYDMADCNYKMTI